MLSAGRCVGGGYMYRAERFGTDYHEPNKVRVLLCGR
jgi:hypothetical protein